MPRRSLTPSQKEFVRAHADKGGNWLAETLGVHRGDVYQYAFDNGFSVKKGGRCLQKHEIAMRKLKKNFSQWPKKYYGYKSMLIKRDGLTCHYCSKELTAQELQVDHVLAKARGGTDAPINLVLACASCNHLKSTLCYSCPEFREAIGQL